MKSITKEQYCLLCNACDKVLSDSNATIATIAIPWLHIIREHPIFLCKYDVLFISKELNFINTFITELKSLAGNLKRIIKGIFTLNCDFYTNKPLPKSVDFIFLTHLINPDHAESSSEFYYGSIPLELAKKGYSVVIAYVNMTEISSAKLVKVLPTDNIYRLIFTKSIHITDEMSMLSKAFKERNRLKELAKFESHNFTKRVLLASSREAISPGTMYSLRIGIQISRLISSMSTKSLITIHEGQSWERVVFASARKVNQSINCIAYQHAVLFNFQHAIFRLLNRCYVPDQIIASGQISFDRLLYKFMNSGIQIRLGGSVRSSEYFKPKFGQIISKFKKCIVLPEGIVEECKILYSFALLCAEISPSTEFIFRLHPSVTFEELRYTSTSIFKSAPNISISTKSLSEDLINCDYALYRGSSAIAFAVSNGLIPIYLSRPNELMIDPLFEIDCERISTPEEFFDVINYAKLRKLANQKTIIDYCKNIYSSINIDAFIDAHNYVNTKIQQI
jgi:hypothetical protein